MNLDSEYLMLQKGCLTYNHYRTLIKPKLHHYSQRLIADNILLSVQL